MITHVNRQHAARWPRGRRTLELIEARAPRFSRRKPRLRSVVLIAVEMNGIAWLLGMTDTEIVLGRSTDGNGDGAFHRLVRYEIARIAEHGTSL